MIVPIRNLGQIGVVRDMPPHKIPANAWTNSGNIRFYDGSVWKAYGERQIFGTPLGAPQYVYYHRAVDTDLWVYMTNTGVYATDGSSHADISNGSYTGTTTDQWEGTHLGGIEIFNNGVDLPQAWLDPALANSLVDLPNWFDAFARARLIRSYQQHLFAFDLTKLSVRFPNLVSWSNPAAPGQVPDSWDVADPTNDAGEFALTEKGGQIIDAIRLSNTLMIYKEEQTWTVNFTGGRFIFDFDEAFQVGPLTRRHVAEWRNRHYVATPDDIVVHDAVQIDSILDDRMQRWYRSNIDPNRVYNQFVVVNPTENELWTVMPSANSEYGTLALITNLKDGTTAIRDINPTAHIDVGPLATTGEFQSFDDTENSFDQQTNAFDSRADASSVRRMVAADPVGNRLVLLDDGLDSFGSSAMSFVERTGLTAVGLDNRGNVVSDPSSYKQVNEIWPELRAPVGTTLKVSVGGQEHLNAPIEWEGPLDFVAGVDDKVDCCTSGRYIAVRFESDSSVQWQLDSYAMNVENLGQL